MFNRVSRSHWLLDFFLTVLRSILLSYNSPWKMRFT